MATTAPTYTVADRYNYGPPLVRSGARSALVTLGETADGLGAVAVVECGGAIGRKAFRGETALQAARVWADDTAAALTRNGGQ